MFQLRFSMLLVCDHDKYGLGLNVSSLNKSIL